MHEVIPVQTRLKWLIVVQMLVGTAPLASFSLPSSIWMLPAMWALSSLSIAQIVLLSFWVGMGNNTGIVRVIGGLLGSAYITIWPSLGQYVSPQIAEHELPPFANTFLVQFASYAALVLLFSGCFILLRRKGTKLMHLSELNPEVASPHVKYSMYQVLVLMSLCSLVLSLVRISQPLEGSPTGFSTLSLVGGFALMLLIFAINSICAAWASLSLYPPWSRIALAIGIALLLGIAFAVASGNYELSWWIFIAAGLIPVLSTAIVIVSLLVVRSCSYRLVSKELLQTRL